MVFLAQPFWHVSEVVGWGAFDIPGVRFVVVVKARPVSSSDFKNACSWGHLLGEFMRGDLSYLGLPLKLPRINAITDVDLEVL